jgi:hypothetical protein
VRAASSFARHPEDADDGLPWGDLLLLEILERSAEIE